MAYNNRGNAKADLKLYLEAIANYDKALEIDPKLAMAYNNRAGVESLLSYQKGELIPRYLYIPFCDIYMRVVSMVGCWCWYMYRSVILFVINFWCEKTLLDVIPIESLFVLIGFFLVAVELGQKGGGSNENDIEATFEILLKIIYRGVGIFVIAHIIAAFSHNCVSIVIENILGFSYIILLYVLMDKMRIIFIKVGKREGYSESDVKIDITSK